MTHYMELLSVNQPWNLILFMAIPVILAETVAISEIYLLFTGKNSWKVKTLSKIAGITGGIYFIGVFLYLLFSAVIPITISGTWRGMVDIIAVGFYLLGVVPLVGIMLTHFGFPKGDEKNRQKWHAIWIGVFLIVAHIAMIFGMVEPNMNTSSHDMNSMNMDMSTSHNMHH